MKILKIALPVLILILVLLAWLAPIGPLPGFFIGGTETSAPDSWADTTETHEIRLEVPGTLPRVVIIWVVQVDGELYIVGAKGSTWVSMLGQGGAVRMRLGDRTYPLNARLVSTGWQRFLSAYSEKYIKDYPDIVSSFPTVDEAADSTSVFWLSRG